MTFERIARIIADNKGLEVDEITMDMSFDEMDLDSLDVIEVVMAIEEDFDITLEVEDRIKTVADLVKLVDSLQQAD